VELSGFAARTQPAVGVLDPLLVKALYVEDGPERLLWAHADVIAVDAQFVSDFRAWAHDFLNLRPDQVIFSATHTHSAPATIDLTGCGRKSEPFLQLLHSQSQRAARRAMDIAQPADLRVAQSACNLSIDRRGKPTAHTDPTVTALAWRASDGDFIAAVANYAMHPVALGATNRLISADWCGPAADQLRDSLPSRPIVLMTNGACGNVNPPGEGVPIEVVREYGRTVTGSLARQIAHAPAPDQTFRVLRQSIGMPLESLSQDEKNRYADRWLATLASNPRWETPMRLAIAKWRAADHPTEVEIDLFAIRFGPIVMLTCNGEVFSRFTTDLRAATGRDLFVLTYANAAFGYIPTREAYAEGGYEVDTAHLFYNSLRPRIGSLEILAARAAEMIRGLT